MLLSKADFSQFLSTRALKRFPGNGIKDKFVFMQNNFEIYAHERSSVCGNVYMKKKTVYRFQKFLHQKNIYLLFYSC